MMNTACRSIPMTVILSEREGSPGEADAPQVHIGGGMVAL